MATHAVHPSQADKKEVLKGSVHRLVGSLHADTKSAHVPACHSSKHVHAAIHASIVDHDSAYKETSICFCVAKLKADATTFDIDCRHPKQLPVMVHA